MILSCWRTDDGLKQFAMEGEIGGRAEVQGSKEGKVEEGQKESGGSLEESELDTGKSKRRVL